MKVWSCSPSAGKASTEDSEWDAFGIDSSGTLGSARQQQKVCGKSWLWNTGASTPCSRGLQGKAWLEQRGKGNFLSNSSVWVLGRAGRVPGALCVLINSGHETKCSHGPAGRMDLWNCAAAAAAAKKALPRLPALMFPEAAVPQGGAGGHSRLPQVPPTPVGLQSSVPQS